jgi:hypothetical protein
MGVGLTYRNSHVTNCKGKEEVKPAFCENRVWVLRFKENRGNKTLGAITNKSQKEYVFQLRIKLLQFINL